jgi:L-asparaginase / beta-aspartyl-peptidase
LHRPISLVIHGGAWDIPGNAVDAHKKGILSAITESWDMLLSGRSAVDAVECAIRAMEDDETFDAGRGSFINEAGEVELDASIMDGRNLRAGAIAAVQHVRNPIVLARKVMEESEHIFLVGMGATRFAREHGLKACSQDELITDRELQRWRDAQTKKKVSTRDGFRRRKTAGDTVGAVALDKKGNIASGTSTGGTPNKYPGRVGDSPLIGIGTYADNTIGGVSTTGWGESMIKVVMAKTVIDLLERHGGDPGKATKEGITYLRKRVNGYGGLVALNTRGKVGIAYNTPRMARGYISSDMKAPVIAV